MTPTSFIREGGGVPAQLLVKLSGDWNRVQQHMIQLVRVGWSLMPRRGLMRQTVIWQRLSYGAEQ